MFVSDKSLTKPPEHEDDCGGKCRVTGRRKALRAQFMQEKQSVTLCADRTVVGGAVPEPATWAMMLLGLAGLALARIRRLQPSA